MKLFGKKHSEKIIEKIAEEFAEIYKKMNWQWANPDIKSSTIHIIPTKKLIAKHIQDYIRRLEKSDHGAYIASGRLFVLKLIDQSPKEKRHTDYVICLNDKEIDKREFQGD